MVPVLFGRGQDRTADRPEHSHLEAFRHWDEDVPQEVSTRCAKCHSTHGYLDFLGEDGTAAGTVDNAAPKKEAERQRRQKEMELISEAEQPKRIKLSELLKDYLERTRTQIEPSTAEADTHFIEDSLVQHCKLS